MDLTGLPLWGNIVLFLLCGAVVWAAGTRLGRYVGRIGDQTGMGQAFAGFLLLGIATSLPELANTVTASYTGDAALAVNSLLGSVAVNVLLLAIADAVLGRDALTSVVARPTTLLQGVLDILLLAIVAIGVTVGERQFLGVGMWSMSVIPIYLAALWLSAHYESRNAWVVGGPGKQNRPPESVAAPYLLEADAPQEPLSALIRKALLASCLVFVAGVLLSRSGEAISQQTGLSSGVVGFVLIAITTSLPEVSSMVGAVRERRYELAIGDIFGTNLFDLALIPVADLVYAEGAILEHAGRFEVVAALLGIVLTAIYTVGLLERENRTILRMGYDSLMVIAAYAIGLCLLFTLQG